MPFRVLPQLRPAQRVRRTFRPHFETLEDRWVPTTFTDPGFAEVNVASGIAMPTAMALVPDASASGRIFITQQNGQVRVYDPFLGLLATPFLSVTTTTTGERGLQGLAFDPDYVNNGYVYIYWTQPTAPIHNKVTRWTTNPANPNVALAGSQIDIIHLDNLSTATNHNGGGILFGSDGMLYLTTGENANTSLAMNLGSLLGKVLRINPHVDGFPGDPTRHYSIPGDNPFIGTPGARGEIFARGFRNPFQAAVHYYYGTIFVNDVGSATAARREEINLVHYQAPFGRGGNYGWPTVEGIVGDPRFIDPLFAYNPSFGGTNCSIVGADFYAYYYPELGGFPDQYIDDYFFADYCGRWIYRYDLVTGAVNQFATNTANFPIDVLTDYNYGLMFYLTRGTGANTGVLTAVYYAGAGPGSAPGGGRGFVVDGVLVDGLETVAQMPAQVAPQTLAELPRSTGLDQVLAALPADNEGAITPLRQAETKVLGDLWGSIF